MAIVELDALQLLFIVSLGLFLTEMILFASIRRRLRQTKQADVLFEELKHTISRVNTRHLLTYSIIYFLLILLSYYVPFLFGIIIAFQLISIFVDVSLLKRIP